MISERLREGALDIDRDGTPSQAGLTPEELREFADVTDALVAALERIEFNWDGEPEDMDEAREALALARRKG